jgi:ribonuclease BN (tRNA processing enzyme)
VGVIVMRIIFLGTNGWFSTETGNTICTLVDAKERYIVFDAGDGIRRLSEFAPDKSKPLDLFISHFHLDHIIGLHQLCRFGYPKIRIFVQQGGKKIVESIVNSPFTDALENLPNVEIEELAIGKNKISDGLGAYVVNAALLSHADSCIGFRIELQENAKKIAISHCLDSGSCDAILKLSAGADLLITECGNLPGEKNSPEWPHMGPEVAGKIAKKSKAKMLALTHFAAHKYPVLSDRKKAFDAAKIVFANTVCAIDCMVLKI